VQLRHSTTHLDAARERAVPTGPRLRVLMEENKEIQDAPPADAPPIAAEAAPVETPPVDVAEAAPPPDEPKGPGFVERFGARTVGLAAACIVLLLISILLGLMVFAPGIAPVRFGSTKAGYAAEQDLAIEKVAVRFAKNFLTFDYRTLESSLGGLNKDATGNFASQLRRLRGEKALIDTLKAAKATSKGTVLGQTVQSIHGDTATVRVFLIQTTTNKNSKDPSTQYRNPLLTLVKTSKGWKVDNVG